MRPASLPVILFLFSGALCSCASAPSPPGEERTAPEPSGREQSTRGLAPVCFERTGGQLEPLPEDESALQRAADEARTLEADERSEPPLDRDD